MPDLTYYIPYAIPALLTGLGSWIASQRVARSNERVAERKRADDIEDRRISDNRANAEDLTRRFRTLMDSYEARIKDLTEEVTTLRVEIAQLRHEIRVREDRHNHDGTD